MSSRRSRKGGTKISPTCNRSSREWATRPDRDSSSGSAANVVITPMSHAYSEASMRPLSCASSWACAWSSASSSRSMTRVPPRAILNAVGIAV